MSDLARTVEDVRRLAPTAGFYWVCRPRHEPHIYELKIAHDDENRLWCVPGSESFVEDAILTHHRIIGPLTPPEAP